MVRAFDLRVWQRIEWQIQIIYQKAKKFFETGRERERERARVEECK